MESSVSSATDPKSKVRVEFHSGFELLLTALISASPGASCAGLHGGKKSRIRVKIDCCSGSVGLLSLSSSSSSFYAVLNGKT